MSIADLTADRPAPSREPKLATLVKDNVSAAIDNLDGCFNRMDSLVEMARVIADRINGGAPRTNKPPTDTPEGSLIATAQARVRRANHIAEDLARELEQIQKGLWA
jgi:hypothetical protein